jgi:hypothetical protein
VHDHAAAVYGELEGEALFRAGRWLGRRASRLPSGRA